MKRKEIRFKKSEICKLRTGVISTIMALFAIMILTTQSGQAIGMVFKNEADTSTPIPAGTGTFTTLLDPPAICRDNIVFMCIGPGSDESICRIDRGGNLQHIKTSLF